MKFNSQRVRLMGVLVLGTLLYAFANIQRVAIPGAVFNQLQSILNVSAPYITALGSAFMYVYAISQLLVGLLIDRWGGVRTIIAGSIFFCIGVILFPIGDALWELYIARALTGLGASAFYLGIVHEALQNFKKNSSIAIACIIVIGYMGAFVANAPYTAAVNHWGLTHILSASAIIAVVLSSVFLCFGISLPKPEKKHTPIRLEPFISVAKFAQNRYVFLFSGLNWGLYYVVQTVIGKKFPEDFGGMAENQAAWFLSSMGGISALAGFLCAIISRLLGNRRMIFCRISGTVCLSVMVMVSLLIFLDIHSLFLGILFCILSMTSSLSAILIPLLKDTNITRLEPYAVACMNFSFYAAVAVFGNLSGMLLQLAAPSRQGDTMIYSRTSYLAVFLFLAICAIPACWASWKISEPSQPKEG